MHQDVFSEETFKLNKKENFLAVMGIAIFVIVCGRMFYGKFLYGLLIAPAGVIIYKDIKVKLYNKKAKNIETQFKDVLISVSDLMQTGYSIENAFLESYSEIKNLYGKDCVMCKELRLIQSRLKLHMNIEQIIKDMASRYDIESIKTFYETFAIAKRTGGGMSRIIKNVCDIIVLKKNVKDEIDVAISAKKMEHRVMMVIPVGIMMYVSFASPGFMDVMYSGLFGKLVMSVCFALYIVGYKWGEKIINVEL